MSGNFGKLEEKVSKSVFEFQKKGIDNQQNCSADMYQIQQV